jgi:serine/threonine protein kinase
LELLIDRVFGERYHIRSLLGRQTGRRTFLAQDLQTEQLVVLKLLLFGPDFTWDDLKLFEREAAVLKSIDLPTIPKYLDCFDVDTELGRGFVLVQTYLEAKSLQNWLDAGRTFSEDELISIAKQLLTILDYLHNRQPAIVHRDLKPSNILLGDRSGNHPGQVYLVDFGSVRTAVSSGTMTVVGTYGYMPPEQFGGQTTPAADLYALGATIICLATGQHPSELPQKDLQIVFERQVSLQSQTIEWLKYLTEPSLEQRCQTTEQALFALDRPSLRPRKLAGLPIKPIGSQVSVESTGKTLKIIMPKQKFSLFICFSQIACCLLYLMIILILFLMPLVFLPSILSSVMSQNVIGLLLIMASSSVGLVALISLPNTIRTYTLDMYGQTNLILTDREISLNSWLFRNHQLLVEPIEHISQIELVRDRCYNAGGQAGIIAIPDHLNIWAGIKQFKIGDRLTKPELEWLAQVCSVWLDLPIVRDNTGIATSDLDRQK